MPHIHESRMLKLYYKMYTKAEEVLKDPSRLNNLITDAGDLVEGRKKGPLKEIVSEVKLFINMLRDYGRGDYRRLPKRTILFVTAALIYFVTPLDFIPDYIPLLGVFDDIFIVNFVWKQVLKDLEGYVAWRRRGSVSEGRVALPEELVIKPTIVEAYYSNEPKE